MDKLIDFARTKYKVNDVTLFLIFGFCVTSLFFPILINLVDVWVLYSSGFSRIFAFL